MIGFILILLGLTAAISMVLCTYYLFQGIKQWTDHNRTLLSTTEAIVLSKKEGLYSYTQLIGEVWFPMSFTDYLVTFQLPEGEQLMISVPEATYHQLEAGMIGTLTYQGTRFKGFICTDE